MTPEPPASSVTPDPGREALERGSTKKKASQRMGRKGGGKGYLGVFLLANAVPAGAAIWFFTRPQDQRQKVLDAIPAGVATRAATAGLAFVLLLVLALGVLPGAKAAIAGLSRLQAWFRTRPMAARILLFPLEMLVGLLWFLAQALFAVDAVAILACAAAFLVYVARIIKPDILPGLPG